MASDCKCACGQKPKLIFSCSGAADVGELADRAARKLNREGDGKMFCLAGIGGKVSGIVKSTEFASTIVAMDGCPLDCAANSLKQAGFDRFEHVKIYDLGFGKGETEVDDASTEKVCAKAREFLR